MTDTTKIAVIGVGYLGHYHAEKYAKLKSATLVAVCDIDKVRSQEAAAKTNCSAINDYRDLIGKVDAVCIVTPTPLHFEIGKFFLEHKVHVFVEKPITTTLDEADKLIKLAADNNCLLQVGHLERFNNAILAIQPLLTAPRFIESTRLAPFQSRGSDVSVILDLMIHDIDIIGQLANSTITSIAATGASVLSSTIDICNARIEYANGCVANVTASRINLKKVRIMRVFQSDTYYTINLDQKHITTYRKGDNAEHSEIISDEKIIPKGDALYMQAEAFITAIQSNTPPLVSGEAGRQALATAIAITEKIVETKQ